MPIRLPPITDHASHILLEGLVDYAGLYPPAALAMSSAVRQYAQYRAAGSGWILGRFICPAQSLTAFSEAADPLLPRDAGAIPWRLSVTGSPDLAGDLAEIAAFGQRHRVCFEECGALVDAYERKVLSVHDVEHAAAVTPPEWLTYLEVPLDGDMEAIIAAIARVGKRAKLRMGGTTPDLIPPPSAVVRFLQACATHGVVAKATAGLHHPLRGTYRLTYAPDAASSRMYGFLNVALAAAHVHRGGSALETMQLLEESNAERIAFSDTHIVWHGPDHALTFTRDLLLQMRQQGLVSFGSCSFTEPVDESRALGWL